MSTPKPNYTIRVNSKGFTNPPTLPVFYVEDENGKVTGYQNSLVMEGKVKLVIKRDHPFARAYLEVDGSVDTDS